MRIYTRRGDTGTTGLYLGGRVSKDADPIEVNGAVDEAQAMLGWARSGCERGGRLDVLLVSVERDLWVLMADVGTSAAHRSQLVAGRTMVTEEMVRRLEQEIDALTSEYPMPREFVVPGDDRVAAALDVARTVVRRAERVAVGRVDPSSQVLAYLNRLSDLVWTMARWAEGPEHRTAREEQ
ncbi:MAG: cob(I)yrinic acid a,c-diamide adenosyltransferase [Acidimicrobiales bacterium]